MELVIKREVFAAVMGAAAQVCPRRGVRPSLKNCCLSADADGAVLVQATDMEVGLRYKLRAESVKEPATILLPAETLAGLAGQCVGELVEMRTHGAQAIITIGRDRFDVLGAEAGDFPEVMGMPDTGSDTAAASATPVQLPAGDVLRMIELTSYAAARDQGRYAINGLYFGTHEQAGSPHHNVLDVVATDGRRLVKVTRTLSAGVDVFNEGLIVPRKMAGFIARMCSAADPNATVELQKAGRHLIAQCGDVTYSAVLIEGIYPKYNSVIPKDHDKEIAFKVDVLTHAILKAGYFTADETNCITFSFAPGEATLAARAPDKGSASVKCEVEYSGEAVSIGLNPDYLIDCLKHFKDETLRLELKDASKPAVIRVKDFVYVQMSVNPKE